ncbi:MAG: cytochrome P450, partial [Planktomarina sp.]|nr:cytochrome P450 [Planktomarina sp.]
MAKLAPVIADINLGELISAPYPVYKRLRQDAPVARIKSMGRTFITKAEDTKYIKDNPNLFSSEDTNTPMK